MRKDRLDEVARAVMIYNLRVTALRERMDDDPNVLYGSKETGAVRRASLDLSRALAELRRSDNA
jgi:hypothetical protein